MSSGTKDKKKAKTKFKLQPLGDRVVVKREASEERTAGGIVLPDSAKEKPQDCGTVVSVGSGKLLDNGSRGTLQVKPGDRVLFTSWAGETFKVSDEESPPMRRRHSRRAGRLVFIFGSDSLASIGRKQPRAS